MKLLIMGPPGVGKGTQAKIIKDKLRITHISTGELLRQEIAETTEIGIVAKKYIDQGFKVILPKNYGEHLGLKDKAFIDSGVTVSYTHLTLPTN